MEFCNEFTKKQIFDHFIEKFINTKLKRQEPFIVENFIASDTKEIIKLNRYHWSCEIKITNGDFQYQKLYYDGGDIVKAHRKNGRFSSVIGPAIMYKEEGELIYNYYINGKKFNSRKTYKNFIKNTLNTTNFNRLRKIDKLEAMKEIYIHYNRTEQLKAITKRINFLKVVEELENKKEI